jgi:acylglycerol lipase
MSAAHTTGEFAASDGARLFTQSWIPPNPRARVLIVHGYGEHSGRYAHVAERLNREGYAVYSYDHRGHGKSPGRMGHIPSFDRLITDLNEYAGRLLADNPGTWFVFGHSLGGLVTASWVVRYKPSVRGLVLTNAGVKADDNVAPLLRKVAAILARVAPHLVVHTLPIEGLSRRADVVERYTSDPLVYHGNIGARTGYEMVRTIEWIQPRLNEIALPFFCAHGTEDKLVPYAATVLLHERASAKDKTLKLFEGGFHELFNDTCAEEFFADLIGWLRART